MLTSLLGPWTNTGTGSTQTGRELADLVLRGTIAAWVPRWTGATLYVLPLAGSWVLIGVGLAGRPGRILIVGALSVATLATATACLALSWAPLRSPGWGFAAAVAGLMLGGIGLLAGRRANAEVANPLGPVVEGGRS